MSFKLVMGDTFAFVKTSLPEDTDVRTARHPEEIRRQLQLLSEGDQNAEYQPKKYHVFLTRDMFSNSRLLFGDRFSSFDDDFSVRKIQTIDGLFATLKNYFGLLTSRGSKFFTALLVDPVTMPKPALFEEYDSELYPLNTVPDSKEELPKIQCFDDDDNREMMTRPLLENMFKHFDLLIGSNAT